MTARELAEWIAYWRLEPFGEQRADWRSGLVAAVMANCWRGKNQAPYKPSDFMPKFDRPRLPRINVAEMKRRAMALTVMLGGTIT